MRRRRRLRTRVLVALVAFAVGALLLTGVGTLALARRASTDQAVRDLQAEAETLAGTVEGIRRQLLLTRPNAAVTRDVAFRRLLDTSLDIAQASLVTVARDGTVTDGVAGLDDGAGGGEPSFPPGVDVADLDVEALAAGETQDGRRGDVVFVAHPLSRGLAGTPVIVLAREIESSAARRAAPLFLFVSGVAVVLAVVVSYFLARRLTRPLRAMQATAGRIAAGDLSARVDLGPHPDDELADLAAALNAMTAQLEHARGLERAFLLSVSHDLRTPLTSIRGYAEAIADGTVEGADARTRAALVIASESRRLERLVADLLDLARLDAREFSLAPRPVDAAAVVRAAVDAFRPSAGELGLELVVDDDGPVPADVDPERLGQIVANLVENALKYAARTVAVSVGRDGRDVVVRVDDDGPGIDPGEAARIFERLYTSRTDPGRRVGTGLGLAIVRELAAAMGGAAALEPATAGSRFVVRLPVVTEAAPPVAVDAGPGPRP